MGNEYSDMLTFFGTNNDSVLPFLQAALDAMTAHIAILDGQGVIIAVNSAWVNYARDNDLSLREYGVGENYCDVCRPAADANDLDAVTISAAIREILTDKHPKQFRYEYLCAYPGDPTRDRWFHLSLQPFLLGELRFIVMSHEDITQKHLAERSRNLLEQAVAQIRSGVVITDQSGTIEYANAAFSHICGYPIDELIGKNPRLLKSGRIPRATYETLWSSISRGETWRGRVCNRRKDGSYYWEEQTISPVRDPAGVITHYVAVKEDVTEAHRRDLLHAGMLRAASDAFLVFDSNGRIVEWSPQAASLFGVSVHKAKGSAFSQIVFEAELAAEFDRELEIFAATGNCRLIGRPMRLLMKNGDGERFTAELSITAVNMDDDWRFTGFIRDLTAAIHTEQQLVQAQKMEAIGQLTGGMAHDFNNLLGIMSGSLDLLSGSLTGTGPGAAIQDKYLRIARDTTKRAAEITKSLMAVARRRPLNPIVMNINAAINELAPLIHQSAGKRITVDIFTSAELPQVRIEPTGFNNALINLVVNSRDAMANGGRLIVYAYLYQTQVEFGGGENVLPSGEYVVVGVDDSGEGMSAETLAKAFEPFFTTKETGKGTGLGLAMVYGFCRQSGGIARITSKLGAGCSIQMVLPVSAEVGQGTHIAGEAVSRAARSKPWRADILIVDDDPNLLNIARHGLLAKGHEVIATTSPAKALSWLQGKRFDLLITDVAMPAMNGVELANRALEIAPELSVVFVTGNAEKVPQRLREVSLAVIEKPVNLDVLSGTVNRLLKGKKHEH